MNRRQAAITAELAELNKPALEDDAREKRIIELERKQEILEALEFDTYEEGTILVFSKTFTKTSRIPAISMRIDNGAESPVESAWMVAGPHEYTYAFLKADGYWYGTGQGMSKGSWPDIVKFITDGDLVGGLWIVSTLDEIV